MHVIDVMLNYQRQTGFINLSLITTSSFFASVSISKSYSGRGVKRGMVLKGIPEPIKGGAEKITISQISSMP